MKTSRRAIVKLAEVHHNTLVQLVRERYPNAPHLTLKWQQLSPGERQDRIAAMEAVIEFAYEDRKK